MKNDRTALGRWKAALSEVLPEGTSLPLMDVKALGPYDNTDYMGLLKSYEVETHLDTSKTYEGRDGLIEWVDMPHYNGIENDYMDLGVFIPSSKWSANYIFATIDSPVEQVAELSLEVAGMCVAWLNKQKILEPTVARQCNMYEDTLFISLKEGKNTLLLKTLYAEDPWVFKWQCKGHGEVNTVCNRIEKLKKSEDPMIALTSKYALAEIYSAFDLDEQVQEMATAISEDEVATIWDKKWAQTLLSNKELTGSYLPVRDLKIEYQPVSNTNPCDTLWPQVDETEKHLFVLDTSEESPQVEFAYKILQGLVNREKPSLYITHTMYEKQDQQWLDELHLEGYSSTPISLEETWEKYSGCVKGAIIYDGDIMSEIGEHRSHMLNQTNVLMMIGSLEGAIPVTVEMNEKLGLPVVFDARGKWQSQFEMMQWAYTELYPKMNQTILATLYPGKFFLMDYLVTFKIFTFWFPEHRTLPEENLLNGILASTPPNTPIIGWWFDWMPTNHNMADALQEINGLLHGSYFGKILTPSHEATNLTIHSGVSMQSFKHKNVEVPAYDPNKIYYTYMLSDGDNLGEALMMRTRELHWDKAERGSVPVGWSFAPATAVMAPPVLNYYMRTLEEQDLIVGGLGVGYTQPTIYLRAYGDKRTELFEAYGRMTDASMEPLDANCLWLINGTPEDVDVYARTAEKNIKGIFTGYGAGPDMASSRIAPNDVVAFRPATRRDEEPRSNEEHIENMIYDIKKAVEKGEKFVEAWVLNWAYSMDMLLEVKDTLGDEYICVRPDVLVELKKNWDRN